VMGLYLSHALPVDLFRPYARSPKGHQKSDGGYSGQTLIVVGRRNDFCVSYTHEYEFRQRGQ
jgi:hypothetical protein